MHDKKRSRSWFSGAVAGWQSLPSDCNRSKGLMRKIHLIFLSAVMKSAYKITLRLVH